jgi:hypothetical protein
MKRFLKKYWPDLMIWGFVLFSILYAINSNAAELIYHDSDYVLRVKCDTTGFEKKTKTVNAPCPDQEPPNEYGIMISCAALHYKTIEWWEPVLSCDTTRYVREKAEKSLIGGDSCYLSVNPHGELMVTIEDCGKYSSYLFDDDMQLTPYRPDTVGLRDWCKKKIKKITEPDSFLITFPKNIGIWVKDYRNCPDSFMFVDTVITCDTTAWSCHESGCEPFFWICDTTYDTTFVYPWEDE